jgi:hypothetical protein
MIHKFINELKGILHYIYFRQSSIEYCSHINRFPSDIVVYRGLKSGGVKLIPLSHSMMGEIIVWPSFASTSTDRDNAIEHFITGEDSILFEILLHPGDAAVCIQAYSQFGDESEILIAASTGFINDSIESVDIPVRDVDREDEFTIPHVKMNYCLSWYDFNIDDCPVMICV